MRDNSRFETIAPAAPPPPAQQGSSAPLSQGETVGELGRPADRLRYHIAWANDLLPVAAIDGLNKLADEWDAQVASLATARDGGTGAGSTGATPSGSGSHPSDRTPSGSAGYAASILRAALVQAAEGQVRYWRERQSHETCPEECMDEDGHYTPMGDDAAIRFGYCNGRFSEADWWLKTLQTMPMPKPPSASCDGSGEAGETHSGLTEGDSAVGEAETPTPDPRKEALAVLEGLDPIFTAQEHVKCLRVEGWMSDTLAEHDAFHAKADRIEAALATLSATDQDGEARE